jgi:hypothetical protein
MRGIASGFTLEAAAALECATKVYGGMWQGGNQWSAWDSYLSFFRHIAKLPLDYSQYDHWERLAEISGPRVIHPEFAMFCDRPRVLTVDEQNRPHGEKGPFCEWSTGAALFSFHGVQVPASVIEHPESITAARVLAETNAEVRRVMLERMGYERFIKESKAEAIHREGTGVLYRMPLPNRGSVVVVAYDNSTPNEDGTPRRYFTPCDAQLRPILSGGGFGQPQEMTVRNALAAGYGLTGAEYTPEIET